jgi:pimeloyl-ACP methyl ester carboxylesterase
VWGDRDRLVPAGFARHVVDALPDTTSVVLPDCGHVPQFEHPELTMRLVREFLAARADGLPAA